eukprot:CAMPEP_0183317272 /NCGR_PEP_ID=MMETSP0160_2-20130417/57472_1 /TAXON_ID=2839 ORGANISM="Odontella Sinensis, Strain Grunow 1884" /NCGR_SAMPLE_ID=MMETSP0160_2 /ASSEMBLY_ACC=CAM_ASM_000250 /LENGTH=93 /DNA_ID=CAMNT_0025483267 /DNA_START=234 /DNA_END=512 /DNA_ORIENTATION=+
MSPDLQTDELVHFEPRPLGTPARAAPRDPPAGFRRNDAETRICAGKGGRVAGRDSPFRVFGLKAAAGTRGKTPIGGVGCRIVGMGRAREKIAS